MLLAPVATAERVSASAPLSPACAMRDTPGPPVKVKHVSRISHRDHAGVGVCVCVCVHFAHVSEFALFCRNCKQSM